MILDIFKKSKDTKEIIGFNFYGTDKGFYCGYVLKYTDDFVIIQHFTKFGERDGILVHKVSDIQYLDIETDYLKGLKYLIDHRSNFLPQTFSPKSVSEPLDEFNSLFQFLIGNKDYLVKFQLTDDDIYFGFVEWCDDNNFSIINIDVDGIKQGKAVFKFEDLKLYWLDDLECRKRKMLYEQKTAKV